MNDAISPCGFLPAQLMPTLQPAWGGDMNAASALESTGAASAGSSFAQLWSHGLDSLNQKMVSTDVALQRLASGSETNLHGVMMQLEDAKLSLQFALQVRNRLVEAYSELARMQI